MMKTASIIMIFIAFIFMCISITFTCNSSKPASTPVNSLMSSTAQRVAGIYQIPYSESTGGGLQEREFNKDGTFFKRSYNKNQLVWIIYGTWTCDNSKIYMSIDSCFDYDTVYQSTTRTSDTTVHKKDSVMYKNSTESGIEFFQPATEESPSGWNNWKRIL